MGLSKAAVQFLAREHKRKPFHGSLLTLGRQRIACNITDVRDVFRVEGLTAVPPGNTDGRKPAWPEDAALGYIDDTSVFQMLGFDDIHALDVSEFEGADMTADLNQPVDPRWHSLFDVIIDAGTSEHVFDVRQCLANVSSMLKPGGRVLHLSPANNYLNHGFYQFSPTLFLDYYRANKFDDLRCFVAEEDRYLSDISPLSFYAVPERAQPMRMFSDAGLAVFFIAEKTKNSSIANIPTQGYYQNLFKTEGSPNAAPTPKPSGFVSGIKSRITPGQKEFLFKYAMVFDHRNRLPRPLRLLIMKLFPFLDPGRKPWGLKFWARLG